jgi:hypothetical protein
MWRQSRRKRSKTTKQQRGCKTALRATQTAAGVQARGALVQGADKLFADHRRPQFIP